jgi:predicted dehydrogenase
MRVLAVSAFVLLAAVGLASRGAGQSRLVIVNPGHFHAALVQKEQLAGLAEECYVYAPLGPDLTAHLNRVMLFNTRAENPTRWKIAVYAGPDYFERLLKERPGRIAVLSGRNKGKIDRMRDLASAGMHVLADKPWVIEAEDLPKLSAALQTARRKGVVLYDGMTQRYEITCMLQKELVNDASVFGEIVPGSPSEPAVSMESVHYLLKLVAGAPNLRPAWFFDIREQGEGLTDVGTHLVDLAQWTLSPERPIDAARDIRVLAGRRWPTVLRLTDFHKVTGEAAFPADLLPAVSGGELQYYCNNHVLYTLRGVHVALDVKWGFEAPPRLGDSEVSIYRGTKARVEVRDNEVFVVPAQAYMAEVEAALRRHAAASPHKGLQVVARKDRFQIVIPRELRIGHEAHFALLTKQFLEYVNRPDSLPDWERSFMEAKYYVTTQGVALARAKE